MTVDEGPGVLGQNDGREYTTQDAADDALLLAAEKAQVGRAQGDGRLDRRVVVLVLATAHLDPEESHVANGDPEQRPGDAQATQVLDH